MSRVQGMPSCGLERAQKAVRRYGCGAGRGGQKQGQGKCSASELMVVWGSKLRTLSRMKAVLDLAGARHCYRQACAAFVELGSDGVSVHGLRQQHGQLIRALDTQRHAA